MKIIDKLETLYPTPEAMLKARRNYNSWDHMAQSINISKYSLEMYRRKLGMEKEGAGKKPTMERKAVCTLTDKELDERIRQMFGNKNNEVKVYKVTEQYEPHQLGTEGLIPLRIDVSQTSISYWERREVEV